MCSDEDLPVRKFAPGTEIEVSDVPIIHGNEKSATTIPVIEKTEVQKKHDLEESRKEYTFNAYRLGATVFIGNVDDVDFTFLFFGIYSFIILVSVIIASASFLNKTRIAFISSCLNLLLTISSLIIFVSDNFFFDDVSQIKFGYYLFVINTIVIIVLTYKNLTAKRQVNALS